MIGLAIFYSVITVKEISILLMESINTSSVYHAILVCKLNIFLYIKSYILIISYISVNSNTGMGKGTV